MRNMREVSTACLDVTLQVNSAWMKQTARHTARHRARKNESAPEVQAGMQAAGTMTGIESEVQEETMLLCSDIICVPSHYQSPARLGDRDQSVEML